MAKGREKKGVGKKPTPTMDEKIDIHIAELVNAVDSELVHIGMQDVKECDWINTGIKRLNKIISGKKKLGIPLGTTVEISGDTQTGKTFFLAHLMKVIQAVGGIAVLADAEQSASKRYIRKTFGVDTSKVIQIKTNVFEYIVQFINKAIEQRLKMLYRKTKPVAYEDLPPMIVFIDSIKMCVSLKEIRAGSDKIQTGYQTQRATAISMEWAKVHERMAHARIMCVWINQLRMKFKGQIAYKDSAGGDALMFYPQIRIRFRKIKDIKQIKKGNEKTIGRIIEFKCKKTKYTDQDQKFLIKMMHDGGYCVLKDDELKKEIVK